MRTEKDFLGEVKIPEGALYGVHSVRATENFPDNTRFFIEWYKGIGQVKLAAYTTYKKFKDAANSRYKKEELPVHFSEDDIIDALCDSAVQVAEGKYFDDFIVPAIQGGAGTSINMNINEIISNLALKKLGHKPGSYDIIDPFEQANIYQSTNDVVPTGLTVAAM